MQALERDPYSILGVEPTATDAAIKSAYKKQISIYHPDKQGDFLRAYSQEVSKLINLAYEKICSARKS
jgi:curved DNA-binding protein CbpA